MDQPRPRQEPQYRDPSPEELARLVRQREVVAAALAQHGGPAALKGDRSDLVSLQRLVDDGAFGPSQIYELQCLGVVLGDVIAAETGLRWVMITDEWGTDPSLQWAGTSLVFHPLTMIAKRVGRGDRVDVEWIFAQTLEHFADLKDRVDKLR